MRPSTRVEEEILAGRSGLLEPDAWIENNFERQELNRQAYSRIQQVHRIDTDIAKLVKFTSPELIIAASQAERPGQTIIYLRTNSSTREPYVGRTTGDEFGRFLTRQAEHQRLGESYEWRILERVETSMGRFAEESWIRRFGGPSRYGGSLSNWRYAINENEYKLQAIRFGRSPISRPTNNRNVRSEPEQVPIQESEPEELLVP